MAEIPTPPTGEPVPRIPLTILVEGAFKALIPEEYAFVTECPHDPAVTAALHAGANLHHAQRLVRVGRPFSGQETAAMYGVVSGRDSSVVLGDMHAAGYEGTKPRDLVTARSALSAMIAAALKSSKRTGDEATLAGFTAAAQRGAAELMDVEYVPTPLLSVVHLLANDANPRRSDAKSAAAERAALAHHLQPSRYAPPFALPSAALESVLRNVRARYAQWIGTQAPPRPLLVSDLMNELLAIDGASPPRSMREILAGHPGREDELIDALTKHLTALSLDLSKMEPVPQEKPPATTRKRQAKVAAPAGAAAISARPAAPEKTPAKKTAATKVATTKPAAAKPVKAASPSKAAKKAAAKDAAPASPDGPAEGEEGSEEFDLEKARELEKDSDLISETAEADAAIAVARVSGSYDFGSDEDQEEERRNAQNDGWDVSASSANILRIYIQQAGRAPLLNAEQEVELSKKIEAGLYAKYLLEQSEEELAERLVADPRYTSHLLRIQQQGEEARDFFLESNLRLVISIAKRYRNRGVGFLDLIQEGNLGMVRAVEKFDYTKGYKFSTYATWWIRQNIDRALAEQARTIRVSVYTVEQINRMKKTTEEMTRDLGHEPTDPELAAELGIDVDRLPMLRLWDSMTVSQDTPIGDGKSVLGDLVVEDGAADLAHLMVSNETLRGSLEKVLGTLDERAAGIMRLRFGLTDGVGRTLDEIGTVYGVTRERIRQIESATLAKLRADHGEQLIDYWRED